MDDQVAREWGRRLRAARKAAALTQQTLAEAAGVHHSSVSRAERGETRPTVELQVALAAALAANPRDLFPFPGEVTAQPEAVTA